MVQITITGERDEALTEKDCDILMDVLSQLGVVEVEIHED